MERLSTGWTTGDVLGPAIIAIMDDGMAASRTGLRLRPPTVEIGEDIAPFVRLDAIRANVTDAAAERLAVFQTPCDRHLVDRLVIGEIASAPSAAHALRIKELYETNNLFYAPRIETHFTFAIDIWDDCASTHFCRQNETRHGGTGSSAARLKEWRDPICSRSREPGVRDCRIEGM